MSKQPMDFYYKNKKGETFTAEEVADLYKENINNLPFDWFRDGCVPDMAEFLEVEGLAPCNEFEYSVSCTPDDKNYERSQYAIANDLTYAQYSAWCDICDSADCDLPFTFLEWFTDGGKIKYTFDYSFDYMVECMCRYICGKPRCKTAETDLPKPKMETRIVTMNIKRPFRVEVKVPEGTSAEETLRIALDQTDPKNYKEDPTCDYPIIPRQDVVDLCVDSWVDENGNEQEWIEDTFYFTEEIEEKNEKENSND